MSFMSIAKPPRRPLSFPLPERSGFSLAYAGVVGRPNQGYGARKWPPGI